MKNTLQTVLLSAALLAVPLGTYADYHDTNIENGEGNLGFGRYFWQLADGSASGGYEDHYYLADVPNEDGTVPDNHKQGVNALTKWQDANGTAKEIETFLHMPTGRASVQLAVTTLGPVTFQFIVTTADQKTVISDKTVNATSGEQMLTALDNAQLPASAHSPL